MSRNEQSHFALAPQADIQRSRFTRPSSLKTTFNVGELVPIFVDADVLPGDTYSVDLSKVIRLPALLDPVMDNLYLDTYWFFVPMRLVWEHSKEFFGENSDGAWEPQEEYTVPQLSAPATGWEIGTVADYFGIPTGVSGFSVNALPFRAYALVYNEWFRSEALTRPAYVPRDDVDRDGSNGSDYILDTVDGGKPFVAAKFHDYFTSALPEPQLGPDVTIPLITPDANFLPVITREQTVSSALLQYGLHTKQQPNAGDPTTYNFGNSRAFTSAMNATSFSSFRLSDTPTAFVDTTYQGGFAPDNLWATIPSQFLATSINDLREAFQLQRFFERLARGGNRYTEIIRSFFGVTSPDSRLQRPEYLGGNRVRLNISQVIQQSSSTETQPLGDLAAISLTTDRHSDFTQSFTEHGILMCLATVRYDHSYQQGLARQWTRKTRLDYYWPTFAHLGEQAVLNREIYLQPDSVTGSTGKPENDEVFGYQEAWAEYRYRPSRVTGHMRSSSPISLDSWHFADDYDALPALSDDWIREDKQTVDRALAVTSAITHQIIADFFFSETCVRPMPLYSVPGLIDHF